MWESSLNRQHQLGLLRGSNWLAGHFRVRRRSEGVACVCGVDSTRRASFEFDSLCLVFNSDGTPNARPCLVSPPIPLSSFERERIVPNAMSLTLPLAFHPNRPSLYRLYETDSPIHSRVSLAIDDTMVQLTNAQDQEVTMYKSSDGFVCRAFLASAHAARPLFGYPCEPWLHHCYALRGV